MLEALQDAVTEMVGTCGIIATGRDDKVNVYFDPNVATEDEVRDALVDRFFSVIAQEPLTLQENIEAT